MKSILHILVWSMAVLFTACTTLNTGKSSKDLPYSEDLSAFLPKAPVDTVVALNSNEVVEVAIDPSLNIRARLDSAISIVDTYNNESTQYIEGLVIQIYAGNDRTKAKEFQMKAFRSFPDSNPIIIFEQPNYKVRLESFYTQLEAYPVFKSVQSKFPKAILIPTQLLISQE